MAAYATIAKNLEHVVDLLDKGEITLSKIELQKCIDDIHNRRKHDVQKTLRARNSSLRQTLIHRIDNKYRYALKHNNLEAAEKYKAEKEKVKQTIFN